MIHIISRTETNMASPFDTQQTAETILSNIEARFATFTTDAAQIEKNRSEYAAEKARKYKIRLINEWRAKRMAA
jgi:hypothetical protein